MKNAELGYFTSIISRYGPMENWLTDGIPGDAFDETSVAFENGDLLGHVHHVPNADRVVYRGRS